jgi:hypothetical protein
MAARDPIISPAANSSGKPRNDNKGRLKSYTGGIDIGSSKDKNSAPAPRNPYKG